jgi:hypothetical protein
MAKVFIVITLFLLGSSLLEAKGVYCKHMTSCKEACKYYNQGYFKLDRDKDGIPCENVCSSPCKQIKSKKTAKSNKAKKKK